MPASRRNLSGKHDSWRDESGLAAATNVLSPPTTRHLPQRTIHSSRFAVVVDLVHAAVERGGAHELVVGARVDDAAVIEKNDAVGELDRAQAVGDEKRR